MKELWLPSSTCRPVSCSGAHRINSATIIMSTAAAAAAEAAARKKRRLAGPSHGASGPTDATAAAAAALRQRDWGIAEVLAECGASLTVSPEAGNANATNGNAALGIQLEADVTPSQLRSSVHALLKEMDRNGVDPNNARVLESLEELIGGDANDNDGNNAGGTGSNGIEGKHGLLRRMLLPTYRMIPSTAAAAAASAKGRGGAAAGKENAENDDDPLRTPRDRSNAGSSISGNNSNNNNDAMDTDDGAAKATTNANANNATNAATAKVVQTFDSSSLVRTLLRVDALQPTLLVSLLQKLPEFASDEDDEENNEEEDDGDAVMAEEVDPEETQDSRAPVVQALTAAEEAEAEAAAASSPATGANKQSAAARAAARAEANAAAREEIPRLILSQIRWLDHVVDASTLTAASVEVLSMLTVAAAAAADDDDGEDDAETMGGGGRDKDNAARTIVLDLIATLPDIVDETKSDQIDRIVETLTDVRTEDPTLLIPCLDALSSLRLSPEQLQGVTADALHSLQSAEIWCLPALCKFLVQNAPSDMFPEVVDALREMRLGGMEEEEDGDEGGGGTGRSENGRGGRRRRRRGGGGSGSGSGNNSNNNCVLHRSDAECLMLESFAQGMQYRPDLSAALVTTIKKIRAGEHFASDIWLLLCCAVAPHNKSSVRSIFRSKAVSGGFSPELLTDAIRGNGRALSHLFSASALDLADGLVRSPEAEARGLGGVLYGAMFVEFSDPMQRQEIVGSLVTHVASGGSSKEIDTAMKVFSQIVEVPATADGVSTNSGALALRPFRPYLSSLLDHVKRLSPSQLRRLFLVLFMVGGNDDDGDDMMGGQQNVGLNGCDDVHIVIRKYLSQPSVPMKRIGIIGAVAYAVVSSSNIVDEDPEKTCFEGGEEDEEPSLSAVAKDIIGVLELARTNCEDGLQNSDYLSRSGDVDESCPETALANLFDELCLAVRGGCLANQIRDWILENFSEALEESFLGDLSDPSESEPSESESQAVIEDPADRAIVAGTSGNPRAPQGAMRFNVDGEDALVYVKFLSLAASSDSGKRDSLAQLCPLLRLLATCHDARYGGLGLTEIDAVVGCPLFLSTTETASCETFGFIKPNQQLSATISSFYAASWCRELVNTFIYSAAFPSDMDLQGAETQIASTPEEIRRKLIEKLRALIEIQAELHFMSSKSPHFTPPGLTPMMPPREIRDLQRLVEGDYSSDDNDDFAQESSAKLSKDEKKELVAKKNATKKKQKAREKSKQKLIKLRNKYEASLAERSLGALRPLSSHVCLVLGFTECSIVYMNDQTSQTLTMPGDELRKFKVGGDNLMTMLFQKLQSSIECMFPKKKVSWLSTSSADDGPASENEESLENPYLLLGSSAGKGPSSGETEFKILDEYIAGHVFVSIYEHLATIAEIRNAVVSEDVESDVADKDGKELKECASLILSCVCSILDAERLTASACGRKYLEQIMKQMSNGDRETNYDANDRKPVSLPGLRKSFGDVFSNVEEIVVGGGDSGDLAFAMDGIKCLETLLRCAIRVEVSLGNITGDSKGSNPEPKAIQDLRQRTSSMCHKLLQRKWADDTKYNKSTVGKLVTLYIDHSFNIVPPDSNKAAQTDCADIGRLEALAVIVNNMLAELPNSNECKGPVSSYPTCSYQSFGSIFSAVLNFFPKELEYLLQSSLTESNKTAEKLLEYLLRLVELLDALFLLTKENDKLAKRPFLLSQLRAGTSFVQAFNKKGIKQLETNFSDHESTVLEIIRKTQNITRQMNNVITHGKREKDSNIIKETPRAKRVLEVFIHKIKIVMRKNNCLTALWGGNLKEKLIDGTEVGENEEGKGDEGEDESEGEEGDEDEGEDEDEEDEESDGSNGENEYETDEDD